MLVCSPPMTLSYVPTSAISVRLFFSSFFPSKGNGNRGGAGFRGSQEPVEHFAGQRAHRVETGADHHGCHVLHYDCESWRGGGGGGGGFCCECIAVVVGGVGSVVVGTRDDVGSVVCGVGVVTVGVGTIGVVAIRAHFPTCTRKTHFCAGVAFMPPPLTLHVA